MARTIIDIPFETTESFPDRISHKMKSKDQVTTHTYREFSREIQEFAAGLSA